MDLQKKVGAGDGSQELCRPGTPSHSIGNQDQTQSPLGTGGTRPVDPQLVCSDFQDSSLSPALCLLPAASGMEPSFTDLSLHQQTHAEFAPLRAYPDFSMTSQDGSTQQVGSRLVQTTVLSDGGQNSCRSLSEHSLSPTNQYKLKELSPPDKTAGANRDSSSGESDQHERGAAEDKMYLQSQREAGIQSPVPPPESFTKEARRTRPAPGREALPLHQKRGPGESEPEQSRALLKASGGVDSSRSYDAWGRFNREMLSSLHQPPASSAHALNPSSGGEAGPGEVRASKGEASLADLWSSGNPKPFLGFLPQSQSTPGVVIYPSGSRVQAGVGHTPSQVPPLPSLSYVEKVDAWRAGQSIGLEGLSGTISEPNPPTGVLPPRSSHFAADPDNFSGLQVGPSVDTSSVPSIELEHFSPYLTSKGSSPPPSPKPLQLHLDKESSTCNLRIDHPPSTILTPLRPGEPNEDPKFSPAVKGSTAPPMESSQPSEGLVKEDFSRSYDATVRPLVAADCQCPALSEAGQLRARTPPPQTEAKRDPESMVEVDQVGSSVPRQIHRGGGEESAVSSTARSGLQGLLSDAKNEIWTGLPAASSAPLLSEDMPAFLEMEARQLQGSSAPPFSTAANPWRMGTRSHSEPALRQSYARQHPPTPSLYPSHPITAAPTGLSHHKAVGKAAGGSHVLCDAAQRTEPEGCSAAPPKKVLTSQVSGPLSASTQQLLDQGGFPRDDEESGQVESPSLTTSDADLLSDRSSDSSLTVRVAKLLQDDPASTTLSSPPSTTEQDSKERNPLKVWAWCRQPLQLNEKDRRGVEEVKRELLLKGEGSTDTGGSSDPGGATTISPADSHISFSVPPPDNLFKPVPKCFPSTSPASPPSAEVSMATHSPSVEKRQHASAESIKNSGFDPPWSQSVTSLSQKRVETVVGQDKEPPLSMIGGVTCGTSSDISREGGQSSVAGTQRVLTPKASAHNLPTVSTAFRQSSVCSPDQSVGSSRPAGGWDLREQQIPESCRFETHCRDATAPSSLFEQAPAAPVLRPYKPPGSDELFYIPDRDASSSPASTMESSHPGSDDAVPPPFSSDVLGQQDTGLEAGVTFRHTEGIYSKRMNPIYMQTGGATDTPAAHTSPPKSQLPLSTNKQVLTREQRTSLQNAPHPEQTQSRLQPDHAVHCLDLLWQKFCESLGGSGPACDREASLVERLQRLSQLIHSMEGHNGGGLQKVSGAQKNGGERWGHGAEPQRRAWGSREDRAPTHLQAEEVLHGEDSIQSMSSWSSSLGHTERTETPSPTSDSSIDTQRLIRVYGAHRVRKLKNLPGPGKVHAAIHGQKRGGTHRTDPPSAPSPLGSTEDRVPAPSMPHRACSTSEGRSQSIRASHLEIIHSRAHSLTRDVGTTFPSPGNTRGFGQTSSSSSTTVRGGGGTPPKFQTHSKRGKSRRSLPQSHPGGVSWFISADTLRSEERKENRSESAAWFQCWSLVEPQREPLRPRQVHQVQRQQQTDLEPELKDRLLTSTGGHISLQEALRVHRPDFILQSRQRMRRLALQAQERRLLSMGGVFCCQTGAPLRLRTPAGPLLRRAVPRKEMIQRSKRIYENLPEVQRRREEERRKAEYRSYRLNAQLYNKRVTERVLGRRSAWR